ncbi:uncharacterized protein LOC129771411 [Toxorhynchites rutilus septentrionalis]|uniref:uncharacterized protein LOC129771411 n=1 Tax=Toxorhynchites rutilus septentrionalis TaxID=329112 RepID=UPI00247991EA|nr:uncharacterized protein LOC129771411 [Toxorhynchites rutilus septentrionalis]
MKNLVVIALALLCAFSLMEFCQGHDDDENGHSERPEHHFEKGGPLLAGNPRVRRAAAPDQPKGSGQAGGRGNGGQGPPPGQGQGQGQGQRQGQQEQNGGQRN